MTTYRKCDHTGPMFDALKALYPDARAYHWFQNAFDPSHKHWLVAHQTECGGGGGTTWEEVTLEQIIAGSSRKAANGRP